MVCIYSAGCTAVVLRTSGGLDELAAGEKKAALAHVSGISRETLYKYASVRAFVKSYKTGEMRAT